MNAENGAHTYLKIIEAMIKGRNAALPLQIPLLCH